jgi:hypothetical protein
LRRKPWRNESLITQPLTSPLPVALLAWAFDDLINQKNHQVILLCPSISASACQDRWKLVCKVSDVYDRSGKIPRELGSTISRRRLRALCRRHEYVYLGIKNFETKRMKVCLLQRDFIRGHGDVAHPSQKPYIYIDINHPCNTTITIPKNLIFWDVPAGMLPATATPDYNLRVDVIREMVLEFWEV